MRTQTQAQYAVYLCDPFGSRLGDASRFVSLKYARTTNSVGAMTLILPGDFNTQFIRAPDGRIEIWRRIPGASREYLETDTIWLIKKVEYDRDDKGRTTVIIEADTPLCVLREPGRIVNYNTSASDYADFTSDPYDNAIKDIARRNIGSVDNSSSAYVRDLSAYISIANDTSQAPTGSKAFAWRDCLKTMQEIAAASTLAGTYLAFDIVASPSPTDLQFRTYIGQRGVDHRFPGGSNPVIFGPDFGNMGDCTLSTDWRNEITYAIAGGRGEGAARLTAETADTVRVAKSPFGLREKFVNATMYTTTTGLQAEAQATVRAGRPITIFKGRVLDIPSTRYGVHWGWGDYVTVQAFGQSFDARIDAVTVTVARGKESIDAWVRSDT